MHIRPFRPSDEAPVIQLWKACSLVVPHNNPHRDIERKMKEHPELFLVGEVDGRIVASVMAGYEGHRGWLNYLAVAPDMRRKGAGRRIVEEAERRLAALDCPKVNLQVRKSNAQVIRFYEKLGYVEDRVISLGKRIGRD